MVKIIAGIVVILSCFLLVESQCDSECFNNWFNEIDSQKNATQSRIEAAETLLSLSGTSNPDSFNGRIAELEDSTDSLESSTISTNTQFDSKELLQEAQDAIIDSEAAVIENSTQVLTDLSAVEQNLRQLQSALVITANNLTDTGTLASMHLNRICVESASQQDASAGVFFGSASYGSVFYEMGENRNDIFFTFRAESESGLLLSAGLTAQADGAAISIFLVNTTVIVQYVCSQETRELSLEMSGNILDTPHSVRVIRDFDTLELRVNSDSVSIPAPSECEVDTGGRVYVGGLPSSTTLLHNNEPVHGFVGCLSNLHIDGRAFHFEDFGLTSGATRCLPSTCPAVTVLPSDHVKNVTFATDDVINANNTIFHLAEMYQEKTLQFQQQYDASSFAASSNQQTEQLLRDPTFQATAQFVTDLQVNLTDILTSLQARTHQVMEATRSNLEDAVKAAQISVSVSESVLSVRDVWQELRDEADSLLNQARSNLQASTNSLSEAGRRFSQADALVVSVALLQQQAQITLNQLRTNLQTLETDIDIAVNLLHSKSLSVTDVQFQERIEEINRMFTENAVDSVQFLNEAILVESVSQNISARLDVAESQLQTASSSFQLSQSQTSTLSTEVSTVKEAVGVAVDNKNDLTETASTMQVTISDFETRQESLDASFIEVSTAVAAPTLPTLRSNVLQADNLVSDAETCNSEANRKLQEATTDLVNLGVQADQVFSTTQTLASELSSVVSTTSFQENDLSTQLSTTTEQSSSIMALQGATNLIDLQTAALSSQIATIDDDCLS